MVASQPWILMCRPEHYGIEYEINAWMSRERPANRELAATQWQGLHDLLLAAGARISLLESIAGLPDLVFTANAAMIYRRTAVIARFRHEVRQRETSLDEHWLAAAGFTIEHMPEGSYFEGAGDALFCGDTLFAGYRMRSDAAGHQRVGARLGVRVIPLELVDPYFYHLDTCFCPLAPGEAIWYPGAFDEYGRRAIGQLVERLIEVSPDEARHFACNAVVVGRTVVTNTGCPRLHGALSAAGYMPRETDLSEFVKAGGSAKCLTLRLDGEDAAAWRNPAHASN
jgi:N-dimethylarginine dimethylaminohydrolase